MHYTTIFDFSQQSYPWWNLAPLIGFVVLGLLLTIYASTIAHITTSLLFKSTTMVRGFGLLLLVSSALFTASMYRTTYNRYAQYQHALATNAYQVVEGKIKHFSPMPANRDGYESFYVNDLYFAYTTTEPDLAFHQPSYQQGPLAENVSIRMSYLLSDNRDSLIRYTILRLEIQNSGG